MQFRRVRHSPLVDHIQRSHQVQRIGWANWMSLCKTETCGVFCAYLSYLCIAQAAPARPLSRQLRWRDGGFIICCPGGLLILLLQPGGLWLASVGLLQLAELMLQ